MARSLQQLLSPTARRRARSTREAFVLSRWTGLNDDSNNQVLLDTDLRKATNLMLYRADLIGSRFGSHIDPFDPSTALNGGAAITAMVDARYERDGTQRNIVIAGDTIYEESSGADPSTTTDITGGLTVTAGTNNLFGPPANFAEEYFFANGVDAPFKIGESGNAAALSNWYSDARVPRVFFAKWGLLFVAGYDPSSPSTTLNSMTVNHSEFNDATTWLIDNVIDKIGGLSSYGDEYVTALFEHRDFLMIGTNRRIYPVTFDVPGGIRRFPVQRPLDVGVAGPRAVASVNGEFTFFMDPFGQIHQIRDVAEGFGDVGVRNISRKIKNYTQGIARDRVRHSQLLFWPERGWICILNSRTGQSTHDEILVLDINNFPLDEPDHRVATYFRWKSNAWDNLNVLSLWQRDTDSVDNASEPSTTGKQYLYSGSVTGFTRRFTEAISYDQDDSENQDTIDFMFATKYFDFGVPDADKSIVEVVWHTEPAHDSFGPTAFVEYDFGAYRSPSVKIDMSGNLGEGDTWGTDFIWNVSKWASAAGISQSKNGFLGGGNFASIEIQAQISGTLSFRLQRAVPLVEIRGQVPQSVGQD